MSASDGILMLMIGIPFGVAMMYLIISAIEKTDNEREKDKKD